MDDLTSVAAAWGIEPGYHDVFGNWHEASAETLRRLIAALSGGQGEPPRLDFPPPPADAPRSWQGTGQRLWVIAVQLYAVRSRRNWGHGDFGDLKRLVDVAAACGASAIGLNPLHALFVDRAEEASPYAPNSRLFLNPLYIDVEAIPEFPGLTAAGLADEVVALRDSALIDYRGVARAKLKGLRLAYELFTKMAADDRRADFDAYRAEQGEPLLRFACFEVLRQRHDGTPWPAADRASLEGFRRAHVEQCEFQEFMQWTAERQLAAAKAAAHAQGMPIGLYIDLAVGIDPRGADAWSRQDVFMAGVSVGAPPDELNRAGQNWGLAPFNPFALAVDDFAPMRQLMRAAMHHAGAIRLDHVLGLKRLFLIPQGMTGGEGAYVRYPFEPLLRVIAEESCRHQCIVIGEDLGTVPDRFRETVARWGPWSYRVMLFERDSEGRFRAPETYPAEALATFNTHDLPSFHGWLNAHDLRVKRGIGLDPGESDEARAYAQRMLRQALGDSAPEDISSIARFLGATPSKLVVVALEDVLGEIEQINVPGTIDQHPNWRRKLPVPVEDLNDHDHLRRVAEAFAQAGRSFKG